MSYFLVLDTSTSVCSVALYLDNQLLGLSESYVLNNHATVLPNLYLQVLLNSNVKLSEIQAIGFVNGPGSYTGLRIGLATVKAICWAHNIPLISLSGLTTLAAQVQAQAVFHQADICAVLDARRMEVYLALYSSDLQVIKPSEAKIIQDELFADYSKKIIFVGNGYEKWLKAFPKKHFIPSGLTKNTCASLGEILVQAFQNQNFSDWANLEPDYMKDVHITKKLL